MIKKLIPMVALFILLALLLSGLPLQWAEANPDWWDTDWDYRQKLTFLNGGQAEDLLDFPVLVKLTPAKIDYSKTKAGGADIRFINSGTELKYEIEDWNPAGDSWVWVKVPQIDGGSNTDCIYMYYGNPGATDAQNPTAVWDSNFKGIWHLKEDPAGTAPQMKDSTSNGNDGISRGSMTSGDSVDGKIYKAIDLDGTDDFIGIPNDTSHAPANVTLSAWVNFDMDETTIAIISRLQAAGYGLYERYGEGATYGYGIQFFVRVAGLYYGAYTGTSTDRMQGITIGNWHYFVGTYNGDTVRIYLDTDEKTPNTSPSGDIDYGTSSPDLLIGADPASDTPSSGSMFFDGQLDEVRVSDIARSADWIKAQYLSMTDDFITFGGEEEVPPPLPTGVGGEVYPVNKVGILAPWLGLALILAISGGILVLRRRRAH